MHGNTVLFYGCVLNLVLEQQFISACCICLVFFCFLLWFVPWTWIVNMVQTSPFMISAIGAMLGFTQSRNCIMSLGWPAFKLLCSTTLLISNYPTGPVQTITTKKYATKAVDPITLNYQHTNISLPGKPLAAEYYHEPNCSQRMNKLSFNGTINKSERSTERRWQQPENRN